MKLAVVTSSSWRLWRKCRAARWQLREHRCEDEDYAGLCVGRHNAGFVVLMKKGIELHAGSSNVTTDGAGPHAGSPDASWT